MSDPQKSNEATPKDSDSVENGDKDAGSTGQGNPFAMLRTPPSKILEEARKRVPHRGFAKLNKSRTDAFGADANMLIGGNRRLTRYVNAFPSSHKLRIAILDDESKQATSAHHEDAQQTIKLSQNLNQLNVKIAFYVH